MTVDRAAPRILRVAVLECLRLTGEIANSRGQFGDIFRSWLLKSADVYNANRSLSEQVLVETSNWDVEHGQYPDNLDEIDALIITGSTASAYDEEPWIGRLERYLQDVYSQEPRVRIYGGCFGHQLVSQALLRPNGTFVEKSPRGWEIGVHDITLNPEFKAHFPAVLKGKETLSCQFLHADHVNVNKQRLPEDWVSLGSSNLCQVQGLFQPGRVMTYQGHPEFDTFVNELAVRNLGSTGTLKPAEVEEAVSFVHRDDLALLCGELLLEFFTK